MAKKINPKKAVTEVAEKPINLAEVRYPNKRWIDGKYADPNRFTIRSIKNCIKALDKIITIKQKEFTARDLGVSTQTLGWLSTVRRDETDLLTFHYNDTRITKQYVNVDDPNDIITITRKETVRVYRLNKDYTIEDVKKMREDLVQKFFTI